MKYDKSHHTKFYEDMVAAFGEDYKGLRPNYEGKFYYKGPAIVVKDIQEAIRATTVSVQWDHMGLQFIVYPLV